MSNPSAGERWVLYSRNENATGKFFIWSNGDKLSLDNSGNVNIAGTLNQGSDRNRKENIRPVAPSDLLAKVAALPIHRWNYRGEATEHLGPMAQDFHAAFGTGADDKHIATVDADGVALAAIQGLNQKVDELSSQLQRRDAENAELKRKVDQLAELVNSLAQKSNGGALETARLKP